MSELLSIVVPVYNSENYLDRCISSIINQLYQNFELIIVNDGSTDSSLELCNKYMSNDPRITVISIPNGGPSKARNAGIRSANGRFITFVDSDDEVLPNIYANAIGSMIRNNSQMAIFNWNKINEINGTTIKSETGYHGTYNANDLKDTIIIEDIKAGGGFPWNRVIDFSLIRDLRFPEEIRHYEDKVYITYVLNRIYKITFLDEVEYNYYIYNNSLTRKYDRYLASDVRKAGQLVTEAYGNDAIPLEIIKKFEYSYLTEFWNAFTHKDYKHIVNEWSLNKHKANINSIKDVIKYCILSLIAHSLL